jgi:beta-galactosidase
MKVRTPYFPIGSSYYPPFHGPEEWERDLANMQRAGLNMIRTAELLASWDYIEPRRGKPEWEWLDRLFVLAEEHGLQLVLGTGSCNPPIWMLELYPDLQRISREGVAYPTNTQWGWACVNHPGLRSELRRYLSLLLERYGKSPALYCWQIDNQIGHATAFTGAEHAQPRRYGYYCYCRTCTHRFREWLEAKYRDIDALNHAWSWDPTHYRYYAWHQITPPRSMPAEWGNGTAWLDFRRFVHGSFTDYVKYQHDLIKAHDPEQLTMHNLYDCLRPDLGARKEPNHWDIGAVPDIIGHDIYPSENSFRKDPPHSSWFLDFAYSVAHHNGRTMWIPELESGPLGGFSAGPNLSTTALDIKRFNLACLGHGAKGMLYQGYRDWNCIPLHWGGLVDFHGEPTDRFHAAADVIRVVKEREDFFLDALPPQAQVALYHSFDNVIAIDGQANERFLYGALRGAHTALWRKGYTIQFVEPRFIGAPTARYKVILLPFVMHLPQEHADKLTRFVKEGGTAIGFAKLGHLDEKGWAWNDRPGAGLTALFGARETRLEVYREPDDMLKIDVEQGSPLFDNVREETILGYWHRQSFDLASDVEVLARFVDGAPAIVRRKHGKGQAILVATHLDIAVWETKHPAAVQLLANLMKLCGVTRDVVVSGKDQSYVENHVDAHVLELRDERAVIVNNEGPRRTAIAVTVPASANATTAVELFSREPLPLSREGGARFALHLEPTDGAIVMLR